MVVVLKEQVERKKLKPGKPSKLSITDQVFVSLEYWSPHSAGLLVEEIIFLARGT